MGGRDINTDHKKQEEERESLRRLQAIVEGTSDAVFIKDRQGRYLFFNSAAARFVGKPPNEVIGHDDTFIFSYDDAQSVMAGDRRVMADGKTQTFEEVSMTPDGLRRTFMSTKGPIFGSDGTVTGLFGISRDITERKQAEAALRTSQENLRQALQASNTGLWDWNMETNEVSFSKEWKGQLGYEEAEIADAFESWETRLHPDDHARAIEYVRNYRAEPVGDYHQEFRLRHKDGTYRWIEAIASFATEPDGRKVRLLGLHRDITERHQVEKTLLASEERFRLVAETTLDILWDKDCGTNKMWWSPSAQVKFGYDLNGDLNGDLWVSRLHPDDRGRVLALVQNALSSKADKYSAEYRFRLEGGSYGHFLDRASIIRDGSGKPTRMIGAMIDVTGAKQAYASLQDAYHRLEVMAGMLQTVESDERCRLSRELHDEVGQLLTALKFDLESLRRGKAGNKKMRQAQFAERLTRALDITDLLFVSLRRIVRSLRPPVLDQLGLEATLESLVADVKARTGLVCSVLIKGADKIPGLTPAGETALYRIAQELLTNVIRHAQANTVSLSFWMAHNTGFSS